MKFFCLRSKIPRFRLYSNELLEISVSRTSYRLTGLTTVRFKVGQIASKIHCRPGEVLEIVVSRSEFSRDRLNIQYSVLNPAEIRRIYSYIIRGTSEPFLGTFLLESGNQLAIRNIDQWFYFTFWLFI